MAPRLATLKEVEAAVWDELAASVRDKSHAWRTPVLATVDVEHGEPAADARTVVLREVDALQRSLIAYSDARAAKARQIARHPRGTLAFWSPALGWQLRCRCDFTIDEEGLAVSSRWTRIKLSPAAQDYLSPLAPGSDLSGEAASVSHREHFAILTASVLAMDWLELHPEGHRRARFGDGAPRWLQP